MILVAWGGFSASRDRDRSLSRERAVMTSFQLPDKGQYWTLKDNDVNNL
jgi:hypothetical protein